MNRLPIEKSKGPWKKGKNLTLGDLYEKHMDKELEFSGKVMRGILSVHLNDEEMKDFESYQRDIKEEINRKNGQIASFKLGVENLKKNLDSEIDKGKNDLKFMRDSYHETSSEMRQKAIEHQISRTEAKIDGLLRAKELLKDGLKY